MLLDAYGTLVDLTGVHLSCVREILRREGASADPEEFHAYWDARERLNMQWAASRDFSRDRFVTQNELNLRSLSESFAHFGIAGDAEGGVELWTELTRRAGLFRDVRGGLRALPEGLTIGVVSNSDNYPLLHIFRREGLEFDFVVTSETARAYKPNARIFRYALKAAGRRDGEALYVGDIPEVDIAGARASGIKSVWIDRKGRGLRPGEPEPDATIRSLQELSRVVML
ncbi:MAG: HAD family hydrolase [Thermoplasmatota archaeon]